MQDSKKNRLNTNVVVKNQTKVRLANFRSEVQLRYGENITYDDVVVAMIGCLPEEFIESFDPASPKVSAATSEDDKTSFS